MTASMTPLPVIGVPGPARRSSTASTRCCRSCRCRPGIPVATVAVGNARNAGLLAVRILGDGDEKLRAAMEHYQADLAAAGPRQGRQRCRSVSSSDG